MAAMFIFKACRIGALILFSVMCLSLFGMVGLLSCSTVHPGFQEVSSRHVLHSKDLDTGCFHCSTLSTVTLLSIQSSTSAITFYHGAGQRIPPHSGQGIPVPYLASWSRRNNCVVTWNAIPVHHPRYPTYDSIPVNQHS